MHTYIDMSHWHWDIAIAGRHCPSNKNQDILLYSHICIYTSHPKNGSKGDRARCSWDSAWGTCKYVSKVTCCWCPTQLTSQLMCGEVRCVSFSQPFLLAWSIKKISGVVTHIAIHCAADSLNQKLFPGSPCMPWRHQWIIVHSVCIMLFCKTKAI